jgi:hypothetical protein
MNKSMLRMNSFLLATRLFCLGIAILFSNEVSGQLKVHEGNSLPKKAHEGAWYRNPEKPGEVWTYTQCRWVKLLAGDGRPPFEQQGLIWIPIKEHHTLATKTGRLIIADASLVTNNGLVFLGIASGDHFFAINGKGDTLSYFKFTYQTHHHGSLHDPGWTRVRLGNDHFDVLPQFVPSTEDFLMKRLRNWGMLAADGKWVIEPRFDGPFRFQNGFAAVLYYGQKRKINEKGEFVE